MSAATLEKPVKQEKPKYVMPRPKKGSRVSWFPQGDQGNAHEAVVIAIYEVKIECRDLTDGSIKVCFHKDHPTAKSDNPDDRDIIKLVDGGTWDFMKEDLDLAKFQNDVLARLDALEGGGDSSVMELIDALNQRLNALEKKKGQ